MSYDLYIDLGSETWGAWNSLALANHGNFLEIGYFLGESGISDYEFEFIEYDIAKFTFDDLPSATAFKLRFSDWLIDWEELERKRAEFRERVAQLARGPSQFWGAQNSSVPMTAIQALSSIRSKKGGK